jgi:predicted ribosomally synthesized peptide with nif11-like leader
MSIEAVHGFINKVNQDSALSAMATQAFAGQSEVDLVGLAEQHGFKFSEAEGLKVWNQMRASGELPDVLLEMVAGGGHKRDLDDSTS